KFNNRIQMPTPAPEIIINSYRHGHSTMQADMENPNIPPFIGGRQNEVELDFLGEKQAEGLGRYLGKLGLTPTVVYCSPANRAMRTFEIAAETMGLCIEPIIDDRLQELDQGEWTNQPRSLYDVPENKAEMDRLGSDFAAPGGESMNMVDARLV